MGRGLLKGLEERRKGNGQIFLLYYNFKNKDIKNENRWESVCDAVQQLSEWKGNLETEESTQRLYVTPMAHT